MIFEHIDYKIFVRSWVKAQPRNGYGQFSRIAEQLSTTSVVISQIFKGSKNLNLEQALKLSKYIDLSEIETKYFILLVEQARAGSSELHDYFSKQLQEVRDASLSIKNIINHQELTEEDKEIFYSNWWYIAIWLASDIKRYSHTAKLAQHFNISEKKVSEITNFLVDKGLLIRINSGFKLGKNVIHLPKESPLVLKHHFHWRMKSIESLSNNNGEQINYSAPMALSKDAALKIQHDLLRIIKKATKIASESNSEELYCLNMDWFSF